MTASATPVLHAPDLRLEPVGLHHVSALQAHFHDWEVIRHLAATVPWPYPDDGVETFLRENLLPRIAAGEAHAWALVPTDPVLNPRLEACGLLEWRCDPGAEDSRGFWIGRAFWGRGLMTQAVSAFQDWVFDELGIERLTLLSSTRNTASRRVKEKTGARIVGVVQAPHHEGVSETHQWELTREQWRAFRARRPDPRA